MSEKKSTPENLSRRTLLATGGAGLAGATLGLTGAVGASPLGGAERMIVPPSQGPSLEQNVLLQPGLFRLFGSHDDEVVSAAPWAFGPEVGRWFKDLRHPVAATPEEIERWIEGQPAKGNPPLAALRKAKLQGGPNLNQVVGDSLRSILQHGELDLSLDFRYPANLENQEGVSLPLLGASGVVFPGRELPTPSLPGLDLPVPGVPGTIVPEEDAIISVTLYGWRLQFRTDVPHPFGWCESHSVSHFHVELFRETSPGRYTYVMNFHLGAYTNSAGQVCFVLWENVLWGLCQKICSPTYDDLVEMFKVMLTIAAIVAGVALAGWIIAAIAGAAAGALWIPLLALA